MLFCDGNLRSLTFMMEVSMRIFLVAAVVLSFAFAGFYSPSQAGETKAKTEEMKGEVKGLKEDIKGNDVKADVERAKGKAKAKGQKAKAKAKEEKARAE